MYELIIKHNDTGETMSTTYNNEREIMAHLVDWARENWEFEHEDVAPYSDVELVERFFGEAEGFETYEIRKTNNA